MKRTPLKRDREKELSKLILSKATNIIVESASEYDYLLHKLIYEQGRNAVVHQCH
jgi:hypothetical protein